MITEVKKYYCDRIPDIADVEECYKIVADEKCIIELEWFEYTGNYERDITLEKTIQMNPQEFLQVEILGADRL